MDTYQLEQQIKSFTDFEIRKALVLRDGYEPAAVDILIQVAKQRGIIKKEEEIDNWDTSEFGRNKKFGVLSPITDHQVLHRLVKSIQRIMLIFTAIPLIYGGQLIYNGDRIYGVISVIGALGWLGCILINRKDRSSNSLTFLRILAIVLGAFLVTHWIITAPSEPMNIIVAILTFLFPVLSTHYLYRLSKQEKENTITK
ncbi:hypothetical protein K4L44_07885 [Halosquirtibacter laminarini]|uniref:Uncharacterized protein n=1 Tax=Halosquirtibacter laminarini TaxID=3374600 RepID=A0AC61NJ45_9BACT|nr:hypothetical protein K4L44_07885 [Prolixibacteraceae bacterium]